jgi:hypothetical protein
MGNVQHISGLSAVLAYSDTLSRTGIEWANIQENFCFIYTMAVTHSVLLDFTSVLEETATFI